MKKSYKGKKKVHFAAKIWSLLKPFQRQIYLILFVTALFEIVRIGGPYLFGKILDLLIKSQGMITFQMAFTVVAGLAGVRILSLIIDFIADIFIARTSIELDRFLTSKSFGKLMELSMDYHEKVSTGAKINIVGKGVDKLGNLFDYIGWEFLPVILQLLFSSVLILITNWRVGLIFSLSLIPFLIITFQTYRSTKKLREKRYDAYEVSSGELGDTISNVVVVKGFAQEEREAQSFGSIRQMIKDITVKEVKRHFLAGFGRNLLTEIFYAVILIIGLVEINFGALTVGGLVFLINLTERSYSNVFRMGRIYERAADAAEPVDRLTELLLQKPSISSKEDALIPEKVEGEISFKGVSFAYPESKGGKDVLKDVSFHIPAGSFTALVGKSGSGKSTIAKLISRYYDPTEGSIVIDGQYDLRDLDLSTFRKTTAVVFQDSPVPNREIWEIISYAAGKKSYSAVYEQVEKAAKLAHAHEFISEFSHGYKTQVGERGVKLSGGQKQRLAIARALFAEPKILIMDEPTSHLDTLSEALIQQALEEISQERALTKIVIAHRLSTVQHADQILVMEKGRLVEQGTHKELLSQDGVYAQIVHQSELKG